MTLTVTFQWRCQMNENVKVNSVNKKKKNFVRKFKNSVPTLNNIVKSYMQHTTYLYQAKHNNTTP